MSAAPAIATRTLSLASQGHSMPVYEAGTPAPVGRALVVFHEAFGVTEHIEDVARRFAATGWHVLVPSLYHRQESPVLNYAAKVEVVLSLRRALSAGSLLADADTCLRYLANAATLANRPP